jgi:hypothetical protein
VVGLVDRWRELSGAWRTLSAIALATMGLTTFDVMGRTAYGAFMRVSGMTIAALIFLVAVAQLRRARLA